MGDAETGEYDVDVVETDRLKTQRDHVKGIKQVIRELQEYDDKPGAPRSAVFDRIEEETDHPRSKTRSRGSARRARSTRPIRARPDHAIGSGFAWSDRDRLDSGWDRSGDEVADRMDTFAERISDVQRAGAIDEMLRLRSRRRRYKRQIDYEIANEIVRLARERFDTAIAIEELSGMSRLGNYAVENRRFNEWSYYRLGEYIEEKAEPYDIPVEEVPPAYTSQTCSRCGEEEATQRSGVHFECEGCGYQQHADANASVMIAKRLAAQ